METPWWKFSSGRFFCFSLSLHFHYFSNKNIYLILNINFLISWIQAQQKKEARGNDDCCELLSNSLTLWIHHSFWIASRFLILLWVAFKFFNFVDTSQLFSILMLTASRCELLSNSLTLWIHHSISWILRCSIAVVSCFQIL